MKLSLCIVGCGGYAKSVLDDVHDMTDVAQYYFASRDVEKARSYCETYGGIGYFGSYEDAARDPRVKAMYFFTPHDVHLENTRLATSHGKHVLMEKPIARTIPEARELILATQDAGVRLMVAENFRFLPAVDKAKELIAKGAIGDLRLIQVQNEGYDTDAVNWRASVARAGGGRFIDGGVHFVDMLINLGGIPERVYAVAESPKVLPDFGGEDGVLLTAHLPGGVTGLIQYSGGTSITTRCDNVKVTGTRGQLSFPSFGSEVTVETRQGKHTIQTVPARRGVRGMLREFRDCVAEDREPVMSGQEALNDLDALGVLLGADQVAEARRIIAEGPGGPALVAQNPGMTPK